MIRIGLGTVQFGLPYGNQKNASLIEFGDVKEIVLTAVENEIQYFDTAAAYGISEERLGQIQALQQPNIEIVTKIPRVANDVWQDENKYLTFASDVVKKSLKNLNRNHFKTLYFHQCEIEFLNSATFKAACYDFIEKRICDKIGVSVYQPEEALLCAELGFISSVQVPVNLVDTRFVRSSILHKLKGAGLELVARSVVLQGVLVPDVPIPPVKKQEELKRIREQAHAIAQENQTDLLTLALGMVFDHYRDIIDIGLLGVDSLLTLRKNLQVIQSFSKRSLQEIYEHFQCLEEDVTRLSLNNPAMWG